MNYVHHFRRCLVALCVASAILTNAHAIEPQVLDSKTHRLQNTSASGKKDGRFELKFSAQPSKGENVLTIKHGKIGGSWALEINGKEVTRLKIGRNDSTQPYVIPAGALKQGDNTLAIMSRGGKDSIAISSITLFAAPLKDVFGLGNAMISVTDAKTGAAIPARITITDLQENPVEIFNTSTNDAAVRLGAMYTRGTETKASLPAGNYLVFATRGMEWSRGQTKLTIRTGEVSRASLKITREVDTTGFIAADSHIHTLTFSGHGDATIYERMLTLAGEGVELAISTDHNHHTDYRPYQEQMQVTNYFTPVTGNEVTTPVGHINAFPMDPKDSPPPFKLNDWVQIVDGIRAKGAKVVILNHPRWPDLARCPVTTFGLNRSSGDFSNNTAFPFDAMELANALAPQPDPLILFHDWFSLLNHGYRITGTASSDTHTVGEPVGQARSYVPSQTDDPTKVDVNDACEHFRRGETSMSLGIFADVRANDDFKSGGLLQPKGKPVKLKLRVASSSWVKPRRAIVYVSGVQVAEKTILAGYPKRPTDVSLDFSIPAPPRDAYIVCVVLGDAASHPSWETKEKFTLAATNPIFLDGDGDGKYSSPREIAMGLLERAGKSTDSQWQAVTAADDIVAVQMLSLMRERWPANEQSALEKKIREATTNRPGLRDYIEGPLPPIKVSAAQLK